MHVVDRKDMWDRHGIVSVECQNWRYSGTYKSCSCRRRTRLGSGQTLFCLLDSSFESRQFGFEGRQFGLSAEGQCDA